MHLPQLLLRAPHLPLPLLPGALYHLLLDDVGLGALLRVKVRHRSAECPACHGLRLQAGVELRVDGAADRHLHA